MLAPIQLNDIKPQDRTLNPYFRSRTPRNSTKILVRRSVREGGLNIYNTTSLSEQIFFCPLKLQLL